MSVYNFLSIIRGPFADYLKQSKSISDEVSVQSELVSKALNAQYQFLDLISQFSAIEREKQSELLQPTSAYITEVQNYRERFRSSTYFNHLSVISESIPALGWVMISPAPVPYIKDMMDSGKFYANRVLVQFKSEGTQHNKWVNAWMETLTSLKNFVEMNYKTGINWCENQRAGTEQIFLNNNRDDMSLVESMTKSLHISRPGSSKSSRFMPRFLHEGKKWLIENQVTNHSLLINNTEMNHVVYILNCVDTSVTINGKINTITVDSCKNTVILFDAVIASVEFINCVSVKMQVIDTCPTVIVGKTDGCQIYLSEKSLDTEIISSKSTEMNVMVPYNNDYIEHPIPYQFKTVVKKNGLETLPYENKT